MGIHCGRIYGRILLTPFLFLLIGRDPVRLRPAMIVGVIEKLPFGFTVALLWMQGRAAAPLLIFSSIDIVWGALSAIAWLRTPKA